ncbi:hypothetical protein C4565_08580 [Candidatus Parcubacteria bacterium]|jgi:hypothetical protein|nr:MAG: hypothetical protein C4565_08580 [Candidatus Parcubacteria bacterium]
MSCKWPKDIVYRKYRVGSNRPVETLLSQEEIALTRARAVEEREKRNARIREKSNQKKSFSKSKNPIYGFRRKEVKSFDLKPKQMNVAVRRELSMSCR